MYCDSLKGCILSAPGWLYLIVGESKPKSRKFYDFWDRKRCHLAENLNLHWARPVTTPLASVPGVQRRLRSFPDFMGWSRLLVRAIQVRMIAEAPATLVEASVAHGPMTLHVLRLYSKHNGWPSGSSGEPPMSCRGIGTLRLLAGGSASLSLSLPFFFLPRGSRYLIIKEFGLQDHDYYGFWGLSP